MKINPLDCHDRLLHFNKQNFRISECCDDLIKQRPFGNYPFYVFAHARTDDDGVTKRIIWQPRLTKPKAQANSMLFKVYPGTDIIKDIWMIPAIEMWSMYEKGKITENQRVFESIQAFKHNRLALESPEEDDLPDERIDQIYKDLKVEANRKKMMGKLWIG